MMVRCLLVSLLTGLSLSDKFTLSDNYSVEVLPPTEDDSPVELLASVNLRNILDVMETKQQIREGRRGEDERIVIFTMQSGDNSEILLARPQDSSCGGASQ